LLGLLLVATGLGVIAYLLRVRYENPVPATAMKLRFLGNAQLKTDDLLRAADVQGGILPIGVSIEELKARLLRLPTVRSVRIDKAQRGSLTVKISERVARYNVGSRGKWFLADEDGTIYAARKEPIEGVLTVEIGEEIPTALPVPQSNLRELNMAMQVIKTWREEAGCALSRVKVTMSDGIELVALSGFRIICGQPVDKEKKLRTAARTLKSRPEMLREGEYLDVSVPGSEAYKPKNSGADGGNQ
jgi:cell division septal protein FtsQ